MADFGPIMEKYTGSGDPKAWINGYTNSLDAAGIPPSSRHVYFCRNLDGPALKWYIEEVQLADKPYWDKLRIAFEAKWIPLSSTFTLATSIGVVVPAVPPINTKTTYNTFRELIEEADIETIKKLINTAGTTFDAEAAERTELLWNRAFAEGYQAGRRAMLKNVDVKLEKEYDEGYQRGIEESKLKYFGMGLEDGRTTEHAEWVEKGHGIGCFLPIAVRDDASTQTDTHCTVTSSIATQMSSLAAVQVLSATMSTFAQTDPVGIPDPPTATYSTNSTQTTPQITSTTLSPSPAPATASRSLPAQPPSTLTTLSTTVTTMASQATVATNRLLLPRKRRNSLPDHSRTPRTPQSSPQVPVRRHSTAALSTTTAAPPLKETSISDRKTSSTTPITPSTTTSTQSELPIASTNATSPKSPIFDENSPKFQSTTFNGQSFNKTTKYNKETTGIRPHLLPIHNPSLSSAATSSLSPLFDYVSGTGTSSSNFEKPTTDVVLEQKPPMVTTYKSHPPTTTVLTPENATITPKSHVSEGFSWADDMYSPSTAPITTTPSYPQYPPRDFSGLRSTSAHPFSSLRRRHGRPKNRRNIHCCNSCFHSYPSQHWHSHPPPAVSLDWDQDPRLSDLGNALRALGWVRR